MLIAIAGSIATDHLMTFSGRFADSLVVDQLDKISVSFLAHKLEIRRGGVAANISFGMANLGQRPVLVGAVGEDFTDYLTAVKADYELDRLAVFSADALRGADCRANLIHTAPSHGDDDYQLGLRHGLKMTHNVLPDGSYRADLPVFGGQAILTAEGKEGPANVSNIKALAAQGALLAKGKLKHSYPHSWRSKAPLIYRNTPQWFAAIDKPLDDGKGQNGDTIRARALSSIDALVTWTPQSGRNRIHSMVQNRPDWVLSRQRAWGVPLTCFTRKGGRPDDADFLLLNAYAERISGLSLSGLLREALSGATVADISRRVHLSPGTVRNHLSSAIGKTGTGTRVEAAAVARDRGWL